VRVPVRVHSRIHACVCEWLFACACRRGDAQLVLLDTQFDPGNEVLRVRTSSPCRILVSVCEILSVNVCVCAYAYAYALAFAYAYACARINTGNGCALQCVTRCVTRCVCAA